MRKLVTFFVSILFLFAGHVQAQCPSTLTTSITTISADCPSSGTATISTNAPAGTPLIYTILSGPSGAPVNAPQDSSVFKALLAGKYTIKVECAGGTTALDSFIIADGYTPLNVTATASVYCGSFTPSAGIKTKVTGGSAPYKYSVIQSVDPNYNDSLSLYTTSDSITVSSYGTYQVRVLDACNQYYTKTVNVNPQLAAAQMYLYKIINNQPCSTGNIDVLWYTRNPVTNANQTQYDYISSGGLQVKVWDAGSGSCPTTAPATAPIFNGLVTTSDFLVPNVASHKYFIETTNSCGLKATSCDDYSDYAVQDMQLNAKTAGCSGSVINPPTESIMELSQNFLNFPVTIIVKSSIGITVDSAILASDNQTYHKDSLPLDNYTVTIVDQCNDTLIRYLGNPSAAGKPVINLDSYQFGSCIGINQTQTGTKQVFIRVDGYLQDLKNATITIDSGASNVGKVGVNSPYGSDIFGWSNMLPGVYKIKIATNCVDTTFYFNVDTTLLLKQSITATATSSCGGGGSITSAIIYNGGFNVTYILTNADSGSELETNGTGQFDNLSTGNYFVKMKIRSYCDVSTYTINSNTVTIAAGGAGPVITKKIGVACEDAGGTTNTGSVYLEIAGGSPLKLEYRLKGDSTWIDYSDNSPSIVGINNLLTDTIYEVRVTSCGITSSTQVAIGKLAPISLVTQNQPCVGSPYTLEAPQIAGANYEWRGADGSIISTSFNYVFGNYDSTYNGTYTCKITWGSCVTRIITVTLSSRKCGQPLSYIDVFGNVFDDGNGLTDNTVNGTGIGLPSGTQLYANLLDSAGKVIASVLVNNDGTYTFINVKPGNDVIQVTTNPGTVGSSAPATQLPAGWVNTGENVGSGAGNDGTVNGLLPITIGTTDVVNANFGIDKIPVANNVTAPAQPNPGGTTTVTVPVLNGNDKEDGSYNGGSGNTIIIDSIPSNGTLYYNGNPVTPNDTIPNYNPSLLTLDPSDTATTIIFTYSEVDSAGKVSPPAKVTMPFFVMTLPTTLLQFSGSEQQCSAQLHWLTANELDFDHFEVEYSSDGRSFAKVGSIAGKGNTNGSIYTFSYPQQAAKGFYRLKMVDRNGSVAYSNIIIVNMSCLSQPLVKLYPNPTTGPVQLTNLQAGNIIRVYDNTGSLMLSRVAAQSTETINLGNFAAGTYTVVVLNDKENIVHIKVIKQ